MTEHSEPSRQFITRPDQFMKFVMNGEYESFTRKDIDQVVPWKLDRFTLEELRKYLHYITRSFGGNDWSVFSGNFRTLDIACGGDGTDGFWPWLPAILSTLGAEAYGIDIAAPSKSLSGMYQHIEYDITNLTTSSLREIKEFREGEFNLITFLNAATPSFASDTMKDTAYDKGIFLGDVEDAVKREAEDLLALNGILFMDGVSGWQMMYRKGEQGLEQIQYDRKL